MPTTIPEITTIQVSKMTAQRLKARKGTSEKTYDELIQELLDMDPRIPKSMAGAFPSIANDKKNDEW